MSFGGGGFSLPGGGALGCASGRFGLGTAAHMTCQRERQGVTGRCGTVVSSAGGDSETEPQRRWGVEEERLSIFLYFSLKCCYTEVKSMVIVIGH